MINREYLNLNNELLDLFPPIKQLYLDDVGMSGDESMGPHVLYGMIAFPYIVSILDDAKSRPLIERFFSHVDELLGRENPDVRAVALQSVCELFVGDVTLYEKIRPFLLEKTLESCEKISEFLDAFGDWKEFGDLSSG